MPRHYYRGPDIDPFNPNNLPNALLQPIAQQRSGQQIERAQAMHECAHACIATVLGCDVVDIRWSKWSGRGLMRANYDKMRLSVPDVVTVLVSGGVGERMAGGSGGDRDDLAEARHLATDEQITRAQKRAGEILRANWSGVCSVCEALQRFPYLKGSTVGALLEAARKAPVAHRTDEDICTARREVTRFTKSGKRKRAGEIRFIAGAWHAYRGYGNQYVGRFNDHVAASNSI
jgi:hypothetical protein